MAKPTNAELELRLQTVFEMTVKGCSRDFIVRYASENWGIVSRTVDNYLRAARKKIGKLNTPEKQKEIIDLAIAQLNDLYVKNYTIQDFRECRNVIESRAKLLGHYEKHQSQKTAVTPLTFEIISKDEK